MGSRGRDRHVADVGGSEGSVGYRGSADIGGSEGSVFILDEVTGQGYVCAGIVTPVLIHSI